MCVARGVSSADPDESPESDHSGSNNTSQEYLQQYLQQPKVSSLLSSLQSSRSNPMVAQAAAAAIENAKPAVDELISQIEPKLTAAIPSVKLELRSYHVLVHSIQMPVEPSTHAMLSLP